MAHHHDAIPSISSRPSASLSRTPLAETTGNGGTTAGMGPYGCHTRPRSSSNSSSHTVGGTLLALRVEAFATGAAGARSGVDRHQIGGERLEGGLEREDEAGDAQGRRLGQVPRAARADAAAVEDGHAGLLVQRGFVGVADE